MSVSRLSLALENDALTLPEGGRIAVFNPQASTDLSALKKEHVFIVQWFYPDYSAFKQRGYEVGPVPQGDFTAAVVFLPRAKAQARALVAEASRVTGGGLIVVDGQKTDGIMPMLKALKTQVDLSGTISKAHGKLVWFSGGDFTGWASRDTEIEGGFITRPGVFSADGPDKGSQVLLAALPDHLKRRGADLGAGWGYLSRAVLNRPGVTSLDLVEADHVALECARLNISDTRAHFHWADAAHWGGDEDLNFVVSNPPFHAGRKGDPDLGRAFIRAAAAMLAPNGQFWMVANRHLPYEASLNALFRHVNEAGGTAGFKVLHALKPRRKPREMP